MVDAPAALVSITAAVHLDLARLLLLATAGLLAGAINAIAGGGSLISFPALLAVGYPAITANVTNTVALVPGYLGGTVAYRQDLDGQRNRVIILGAVSAVGGLAGAILLLISPSAVFRSIVPWLILLSCALLALQGPVTRLVRGRENERDAPRGIMALSQFLSSVYGGYFGAGLGVLMLGLMGVFMHDTLQRLNALKGVLSLSVNLVAAIVFALFGPVAWVPVAVMVLASLVGGNLGVYVARRLSSEVLRVLVIGFGLAVAIRLLV